MLSIKHAAEYLDVSPDFIRDHIQKGTISTVVLKSASGSGTRQPVRLLRTELDNLIDQFIPGLDSVVNGIFARNN